MKKLVTLVLCLMMLLTSAALAEGMGVQVIGGPALETEPVSLDDLKLNLDAEIDGYGIINIQSCETLDKLGTYRAGTGSFRYGNGPAEEEYYKSGNEADYLVLYVDIVNTALQAKDFLKECEVKVVYDDVYEYGGWCYQRNFDNSFDDRHNYLNPEDKGVQNKRWAIKESDQFAIDPMYQGHYIFGCTLPNAVINSKKPLKMIITIDGNELTYNVRK